METTQTRLKGRVIKVHSNGWGFVISKEKKFTKFFFHWTALIQRTKRFEELEVGDEVEFTPINLDDLEKGPRAIQMEVLSTVEKNEEENENN